MPNTLCTVDDTKQNWIKQELTMKMPHKESCHQSHNSCKDYYANNGTSLPCMLLLQLFGICSWQKCDCWVPVLVLKKQATKKTNVPFHFHNKHFSVIYRYCNEFTTHCESKKKYVLILCLLAVFLPSKYFFCSWLGAHSKGSLCNKSQDFINGENMTRSNLPKQNTWL